MDQNITISMIAQTFVILGTNGKLEIPAGMRHGFASQVGSVFPPG